MKHTIVFLIEYDGTNYSGWQRQKNSNSVQETIERAIEVVSKQRVFVVGAGRTDTGVHALGQVAHSIVDPNFPIPEKKLVCAINSSLPLDIRILQAKIIENKFHATKDAIAREYWYLVTTKNSVFLRNNALFVPLKLDINLLNETASIFIGEHNFEPFAKKNPSTKNYICSIEVSKWLGLSSSLYLYIIKANRFVYGLVRSLVGAMLDVARGRRQLQELQEALRSGRKNFPTPLAKEKGLYLAKVYYPPEKDYFPSSKKNFDFQNLLLI
ncbi:MAG: tRNA pseudouridine(38-40) synthase TruA [Candidatus Kapaibacteriota bacterium]